MFFHSLSEATFHKGLKIYLSKSTSNPEGVAEPSHLYEALQQAADEDDALPANYKVEELFGSWETQAGYPIVFVERSYNNHRIRFTQVRMVNWISAALLTSERSFEVSKTEMLEQSFALELVRSLMNIEFEAFYTGRVKKRIRKRSRIYKKIGVVLKFPYSTIYPLTN